MLHRKKLDIVCLVLVIGWTSQTCFRHFPDMLSHAWNMFIHVQTFYRHAKKRRHVPNISKHVPDMFKHIKDMLRHVSNMFQICPILFQSPSVSITYFLHHSALVKKWVSVWLSHPTCIALHLGPARCGDEDLLFLEQ